MVAFRCPCGKTTGGTKEFLTVPSDKEGHSWVVCSEECYDKYKDGYNERQT